MTSGHTTPFAKLLLLLLAVVLIGTVHGYSVDGHASWSQQPPLHHHEDVSRSFDDNDSNNVGSGMVRSFMSAWNGCVDEENALNNGTVTCQGVRIVRKVLTQLLDSQKSLEIANGVQLVKVDTASNSEGSSRGFAGDAGEGATFLGRLSRFLQSHELRVRLPDLLPSGEDWTTYLSSALQLHHGGHGAMARKKDKGGGAILAMGAMMGGMMMAMGIAGVGAMAMKALGVAAIALVLAAVAALKKLASKDDDGGHHVSVVPVHHGGDYHRRRRDAAGDFLAYRGYFNS